jgi:hypothetical protein
MVPAVIRGQAVESAVINGVVLVFGELPVAEVPAADDAPADEPPKPKQGVIVFSGSFDELVYGSGSNVVDARAGLDTCLEQKVEKIDRISELTDTQRQKIQLAGRGDIKRLFDRAERLREMCDRGAEIADLNQFQKWTEELQSETNALRRAFHEGPFDAGSLMAKCMKTVLTAEQAAKYVRYEATPPYQAPKRDSLRLEGVLVLPR